MTDRVLSDNELNGVALSAWHGTNSGYPRDFLEVARAVEAAVLAKVRRDLRLKDGYARIRNGDLVTEREARTRERAAWDAALAWRSRGWFPDSLMGAAERERDRNYPLSTKPALRTVVLSCGLSVELRAEGWVAFDKNSSGHYGNTIPFNLCLTPADARLLADLVERPFDEVPDDA